MKILRFNFAVIILSAMFAAGLAGQTALPTPSVSRTPEKAPVQTLSYLRSRIAMTLANPSLRRGQVGVKIISAATGATVYERNAQNYFVPASNMKSYTVAAALDRLTPDFRFKTSVYASAFPDSTGNVAGDLIIYGRGDPSFSEEFSTGEPYRKFDELAEAIARSGVKKIEGAIIGDESYFNTNSIPNGWEWDDLQWYYGAEISALTSFDNAFELRVSPGAVGSKCTIQVSPFNTMIRVVNRTLTTSRSEKRTLKITKLLGQNVVEVTGNVPSNDRGFKGRVALSNPAALFAEVLSQRLRLKGVTIRGGEQIGRI